MSSTICGHCFAPVGNNDQVCSHCGKHNIDQSLKGALPIGTKLRDYVIGKVLGEPGGFGITYLASHPDLTRKRYAIKELFPADLVTRSPSGTQVIPNGNPASVRRFALQQDAFLHEAQVLDKINGDRNPEIVKIETFFRENGTAYIVMPFYDGMTLDQLVRQRGMLAEEAVLHILRMVLRGLRVTHREEQLHRDIKPENVYLKDGAQPVLIDFGNARQLDDSGVVRRGTLNAVSEGFAPPEQASGHMGKSGDLYSVGAVAYYCLTGVRPISAEQRVMGMELAPTMSSLAGKVNPLLIHFMERCLQLEAGKRFHSAESALDFLKPLLDPQFDWVAMLPQGDVANRLSSIQGAVMSGRPYALQFNWRAFLFTSFWLLAHRVTALGIAFLCLETVLICSFIVFDAPLNWISLTSLIAARVVLGFIGDWLRYADLNRYVDALRKNSATAGVSKVGNALAARLRPSIGLAAVATAMPIVAMASYLIVGNWAEAQRSEVAVAIYDANVIIQRIREFREKEQRNPVSEELVIEKSAIPRIESFQMRGPHLQLVLAQPPSVRGKSVLMEYDVDGDRYSCVNRDLPIDLTPSVCDVSRVQ